jgi:hypothetical protein
MRAHLNADTLFAIIRKDLQRVPDHRAANVSIPLDDVLMSAFAMFSLKDPSLLAFDNRRQDEPESLHGVYGVGVIPSDTQMRTILDEIIAADRYPETVPQCLPSIATGQGTAADDLSGWSPAVGHRWNRHSQFGEHRCRLLPDQRATQRYNRVPSADDNRGLCFTGP